MFKRNAIFAISIIALNIAGISIYDRIQNNSNSNENKKLLQAIQNDPQLAKAFQETLMNSSINAGNLNQISKGEQGEKGAKGDQGDKGEQGEKGAKGTNGSNGSTVIVNQNSNNGVVDIQNGGTGATNSTAALNALLPQQTGNANKVLGTDGANASWINTLTGFPKLNSVIAPRATTTNITAEQIKSGLTIGIAPSDGSLEDRPRVLLPDPVEDTSIQGYIVQIMAEPRSGSLNRMGASLGYPRGKPGLIADFANINPTDLDFTDSPITILYEVNGITKEVTLTQNYTTPEAQQNLIFDIFAEALAEGVIEFVFDYDTPGIGPNIVAGFITTAVGDQATISILDPGSGDPLNLGSLTSTAGFDAYQGYDGGELGVGELNEANPIGGGFTHTWPDDPYGIDQQTLTVIATAAGWRSLKTAPRSEFVSFSPKLNWFLTNNEKNVGAVINKFDEEIFNIRTRLDALEQ